MFKKLAGVALAVAAVLPVHAQQFSSTCGPDLRKFCAGKSGDSAQLDCLLDHQKDVGDDCYDAMKWQLDHESSSAPAPTPAPAPAPVANDDREGADRGRDDQEHHEHCHSCGKVVSVKKASSNNAQVLGILGGALAGGLLGNQIGHGTGKAVATIAGTAGGAYAGDRIAESQTRSWAVKVHFEDGSEHVYNFDHDPGFQEGDRVKRDQDTIFADPR